MQMQSFDYSKLTAIFALKQKISLFYFISFNCLPLFSLPVELANNDSPFQKMHENPTSEMDNLNERVSNFQLRGRHTFSSVLAQLPSFLTGRTADEINPVNAFSVLLHLCNENVSILPSF